LATMLAGNIGFESELGTGSTFWLDIPVTLGT
jgi:chemotaxis protein histidine kinase CheA